MPRRRKGADEQVDALFPDEPAEPEPEPEPEDRRGTPPPVGLGDEFWTGIHAANALRAEDEP